ncbi:hypothetical protein IXO792_14400 [Xanthomonas oryzae pv. oryzae]|uniref:Uncharacterized protein n=4 Tax=Gammaproteobacteria TaxID=1236 RepID=A0AAJ5MGH4_XANOO|nr:hypothetical protein IXO792_14400 [Xanthomonas oryzae pv. oryzae]UZF12750.1 hypothetical protein IXO645_009465 [Xanthomonas oryzae pv. oryzae]
MGEVVDGLARADTAFAHCRIETTYNARYRYLVYNHHYVERLIGQPIQGIFTVGEVDTVHQKRIQEIESRNGELDGLIASATERVRVPDEMRDLEHECHLIPQAGGDCLTAINFYEDARELLEGSFLPTEKTERFIQLLEYADSRTEIALKHFYNYLDTARH